MGYASYAHFRLADTMAKTPEAVTRLLTSVWAPARDRAATEEAALQKEVTAEGGNFRIAPWDWRHYAERVRKRAYDFDEAELKPYLQLDRMIAAAFHVAGRLFGLSFEEVTGTGLYHPDVRVWKVARAGKNVGTFLGDYFARTSKRSGAWMSALRDQQKLTGDVPSGGRQRHEFRQGAEGAADASFLRRCAHSLPRVRSRLHGLLSDVTYPSIAGTNVARDFVSCRRSSTSTGWSSRRCLSAFAVHADTGKPMPKALLDKVLAARRFNQGFATVEYTSSALVDLDLHLFAVGRERRRHRLREGGAGKDRHAAGDGDAPSHAALRPHLLRRRLCLRLLQLPVVGGARCRRLRGHSRRPATSSIRRPASACTTCLFGRLSPRSGGGLHCLPRPPADFRCAAPEARADGKFISRAKGEFDGAQRSLYRRHRADFAALRRGVGGVRPQGDIAQPRQDQCATAKGRRDDRRRHGWRYLCGARRPHLRCGLPVPPLHARANEEGHRHVHRQDRSVRLYLVGFRLPEAGEALRHHRKDAARKSLLGYSRNKSRARSCCARSRS